MKRQNRRGKRPTERGNAVFVSDSGGPSSQARIPIARSFFSFCVLRYLPTRGHGVAALFFSCVCCCMREEISRNPWTEHLCRGWTPRVLWGLRPDRLTETAARGKHWLHNGDRCWSWHASTHTVSETILLVDTCCSVNWHARPMNSSGVRDQPDRLVKIGSHLLSAAVNDDVS